MRSKTNQALMAATWLFAAVCAAPASGSEAHSRYTTSRGVIVDLPPLAAVNCADVADLIRTIDATDYRDVGPKPPTHPADKKLFHYESALWMKAYRECGRESDHFR